jgi:hypothetical protein
MFLALPAVETRRRVRQGRRAPLFWWEVVPYVCPKSQQSTEQYFPEMNGRNRWKTRLCQQFDVDLQAGHANHGNRCHLMSTATNGPARANLRKASGHYPLAIITYCKAQVRGKPKTRSIRGELARLGGADLLLTPTPAQAPANLHFPS